MKKNLIVIAFVFIAFCCSSCFEIIEEIEVNADGSGKFGMTINASQSKGNLSSLMKLDSIQGQKIPKKEQIDPEIEKFRQKFASMEGISKVVISTDYSNFIISLKCEFKTVANLDKAIIDMIKSYDKKRADLPYGNLTYDKKTLERKIPYDWSKDYGNINAQAKDVLTKASYVGIFRMPAAIKNPTVPADLVISPSKKSAMLKYTLLQLASGSKTANVKISH
ncbi:MAG: hypothetical protein EAZ97_02215 [Bacteroidetes bacterium]|nr:MAG: hypothetical protein EAZ97_02215 [Bacteroidota bacterium]